mmetsp:Transcript_24403/g.21588  ORF Transcript_24403/g.21588 Transcript_24403/m.21588 type:complete len:207 (+) Transcript_24403:1034-1654(+)
MSVVDPTSLDLLVTKTPDSQGSLFDLEMLFTFILLFFLWDQNFSVFFLFFFAFFIFVNDYITISINLILFGGRFAQSIDSIFSLLLFIQIGKVVIIFINLAFLFLFLSSLLFSLFSLSQFLSFSLFLAINTLIHLIFFFLFFFSSLLASNRLLPTFRSKTSFSLGDSLSIGKMCIQLNEDLGELLRSVSIFNKFEHFFFDFGTCPS